MTMMRIRRAVGGSVLIGGATFVVGLLEQLTGAANASVVYLAAVVVAGLYLGTGWAIAAPEVVISVVLFLFVGVVVGRLAGAQRERATAAAAREREARALFGLSRELATRDSTDAALARIATVLRE